MNANYRSRRYSSAAIIGALSLLTACGGGGAGETNVGPTPQRLEDRDASASVAGLIGFAQRQIARKDADTAEPRLIDGISPPSPDNDEPQPL